jgi:hypothetical protein
VCDVVATTSCTYWQLDVKHYVEAIRNNLSNYHAALKVLFKLSNERLEEARQLGSTLRVSRVHEEEELLHRLVTRTRRSLNGGFIRCHSKQTQ